MDDLVVVVDELSEAQHVAIEVDEPIHVAEGDIADAVVDLEERQALGRAAGFLICRKPGANAPR